MKTVRIALVGVLVVALGMLAMSEACGGKLTVGYDDAGNYHTGDGSVLVHGSACVGWDASHYADGNIDLTTACDLNTDECNVWFMPPGWPQSETCYRAILHDDAGVEVDDDAGHPVFIDSGTCGWANSEMVKPPTCNRDDGTGDAFCAAWFDQFVTHGHVPATCGAFMGAVGKCAAAEEILGCSTFARFDEDGGETCFAPCGP